MNWGKRENRQITTQRTNPITSGFRKRGGIISSSNKTAAKASFIDKFPVKIGLYTKKKQGTLERA
jgi:hypothetical protein